MSEVVIMSEQEMSPGRLSYRRSERILICLGVGFLLSLAETGCMARFPTLVNRVPSFLIRLLNLPGVLYCDYLTATQTLPTDDIALYEMGRDIQCSLVGIALNIPYYALLIYVAWWLYKRWRRSRNQRTQLS